MIPPSDQSQDTSSQCPRSQNQTDDATSVSPIIRSSKPFSQKVRWGWLLSLLIMAVAYEEHLSGSRYRSRRSIVRFADAHIVLTRDDRGQSLVLTGEDGKGGKGGKGGGGDQLVIAGHNMGGNGQSSNMVMQDASNREGDVVINGNSMIVPGEDGHIVLADSRGRDGEGGPPPPPPNLFAFWMPYLSGRMDHRMWQFFAGAGGGGGRMFG